MTAIGKPLDRVDGLLKVTGQARYAGEFPEDGLLHGSVVSSTVAKGRVLRIDASKALALPGVVAVIHHLNRPKIASYDDAFQADRSAGPFGMEVAARRGRGLRRGMRLLLLGQQVGFEGFGTRMVSGAASGVAISVRLDRRINSSEQPSRRYGRRR